MSKQILSVATILFVLSVVAYAGPYTEQGVSAFVDSNGMPSSSDDPNSIINPVFKDWAASIVSYEPTPGVYLRDPCFYDPNMALGPVTGDLFDVVSLGDLNDAQIEANVPLGQITLGFNAPVYNGSGCDFVVFENGWGPVSEGKYWCELAYVEVSSNGIDFIRFPSVSLTAQLTGRYGLIDITDIYNLAGKFGEDYSEEQIIFFGTPFDLSEIANDPLVLSGVVNINDIKYIRIVDVVGSGNFYDEATHFGYSANHPIYDPWLTWGSEGFDLESIGILHSHRYHGDIDLDGIVDFKDLFIMVNSWLKQTGEEGWVPNCDIAEPKDGIVNFLDYAVLAGDWLKME